MSIILFWYLRNLLIVKTSDDAGDILDMSAENQKDLEEDAVRISGETLMRYIRIFSELSNQLRDMPARREFWWSWH